MLDGNGNETETDVVFLAHFMISSMSEKKLVWSDSLSGNLWVGLNAPKILRASYRACADLSACTCSVALAWPDRSCQPKVT